MSTKSVKINDEPKITKSSFKNKTIEKFQQKKLEQFNLEKKKFIQIIYTLQSELFSLKKKIQNSSQLEQDLKLYESKCTSLEIEIEKYKKEILDLKEKYNEEIRNKDMSYIDELRKLKNENEVIKVKIGMTNDLTREKNGLLKAFNIVLNEKNDLMSKHDKNLRQIKIDTEMKLTKLKNKLIDSVNETQAKATELNIEHMNVSSKLIMLQNHQLLIQLEYQSQQLDEITAKKDALEKKVFELTKDIEIHKEVELSLAEKNKKLKSENDKLKNNSTYLNNNTNNNNNNTSNINNFNSSNSNANNSTENRKKKNLIINTSNNINITEDDKSSENNNHPVINTNSFNNISTTVDNNNSNTANNNFSNITMNNRINLFNNNTYTRMLTLEKKVLTLEKKLMNSRKDYNIVKDKNEFLEKILKNYEKKYSGLFNFFEECLDQFFNDEELINNKEIYVNIDSIRKCDFSNLNKEEKYSTLIILMKYLMPLMDSSNVLKQNQANNSANNVNLKFYLANKKNYADDGDIKKISSYKKNKFGNMLSINNIDNINTKTNKDILPNITNNNYGK